MSQAATTIREARLSAGLSQAELAERLKTSQAAIARLERPGANPTVAMLRRALRCTGHRLDLRVIPQPSSVDLPQLMRHLGMTPTERLSAHQAAYDNMRRLTGSSGPGG